MTEIDPSDVLEFYVSHVQNGPGGVVRDASALRYPKPIIKRVLSHCVEQAGRTDERETLEALYLSLADFQNLSDDEQIAIQTFRSLEDPSGMDDEMLLKLASRMAEVGEDYQAVVDRIKQETERLQIELALLEGDTTE